MGRFRSGARCRCSWLLCSSFTAVPPLAQAVHGALRGLYSDAQISRIRLTTSQQILYSHIVAVVNEFPAGPARTRYAQAAMSWRHPYWDWAAEPSNGESVLPASMTSPTVTVTMPNGTSTIDNPLYAYRFHPVSKEDFYFDPVILLTHLHYRKTND